MNDQTISELLILLLLAISCSRIFFQRQVRSDVLSIIPVLALIISVLNFLAWGISLSSLVVFTLSFFVLIWNIRAILRLNAQLVIDHYGPLFVIISIINLGLVLFAGIFIFIHRPVKINEKKLNVSHTITSYSGSFATGFTEISKPFKKQNALVWKYELKTTTGTTTAANPNAASKPVEPRKIILFMPDKCSSILDYEPFLVRLAHDGYIVYTADFHCKDLSWFNSFLDSSYTRQFTFLAKRTLKKNEFTAFAKTLTQKLAEEFSTLAQLVPLHDEDIVLMVGDQNALDALPLAQTKTHFIDGTFNLATVEGYTTAGYGPIEQTDPFLAHFLGYERDSSLYMSAHLATSVEQAINGLASVILYVSTEKPQTQATTQVSATDLTPAATQAPVPAQPSSTPIETPAAPATPAAQSPAATTVPVEPSVPAAETPAASAPAATAAEPAPVEPAASNQ